MSPVTAPGASCATAASLSGPCVVLTRPIALLQLNKALHGTECLAHLASVSSIQGPSLSQVYSMIRRFQVQ